MASLVHLDDVSFGDPEVDAAFRKWREAIEQANNWQVFGAAQFEPGPTGYTLHVGSGGKAVTAVASTGGIPGRVSATELGEGAAVLWPRTAGGPDLVEGDEVTVYNPFDVDIPAGTFVVVVPDGGAYLLVGSDCVAP